MVVTARSLSLGALSDAARECVSGQSPLLAPDRRGACRRDHRVGEGGQALGTADAVGSDPEPNRILGRLRRWGPLSQPELLLEPMAADELDAWQGSVLCPEGPQP